MKFEKISIKELIPATYNPRKDLKPSDKEYQKIKNSIQEFGYVEPIIVNTDNTIIGGHQRVKVLKDLGYNEIDVIKIDIDKTKEKALNIALNKITGEWDYARLSEVLEELKLEEFDLDITGFELDELDDIFKKNIAQDYDEYVKGSLREDFIVPPVNIWDTRQGEWIDRKREWRNIIGDSGETREDTLCLQGLGMVGVSLLDPVLVELINLWFTPDVPNPKTFDCFAGGVEFGFISAFKGAEFTGVELRKEQIEINNSRLKNFDLKIKYHEDDGQNILKYVKEDSQDLFFSCPPYFDLEVYSDLEEDASNQKTYKDFYKIIDNAFKNSVKGLKNNRFAVIVVGDIRNKKDGGSYYGFPDDIKKTMKEAGLKYYNDITLINSYGTAGIRARNQMKNRKVVNVKQSVLVFYKGNIKDIQKEFKEIKSID